MTLSTAAWLADEHGHCAYGAPTAQTLLQPRVSLYFAAAYLQYLSAFAGRAHGLAFTVAAYRSGAPQPCAR